MRNNVEILIVEDSQTQAVQLQHMLEQHGFRVFRAGNGREAVAAIRARRPTLVISDIVMPEMDGYQLSRYIKENPALKDLPIILLTTLGSSGEVMKALESKADNFVTKPYNEQFLLSRIKYTLLNQKLHKQAADDGSIEILYAGKKRRFTSEPSKMVNLLLSTFDNAIQKNRELERANREQLKSQLALKRLNEQLEDMVDARTQALAVSEESHRALLDNNADAIIVIDKSQRIRFVNPAAEALLGRSAENLLHTSLDFPLVVGQSTEVEIPRAAGDPVVTEVRAVETQWEGEAACLASLRDITARKQAEATLQQAKEVAEAAARSKSEFLANMSHEIRTPMNGIIGMTGLLSDTALTPEQREYAGTVEACAKSLLGIMEDVLNFSTMEAGRFEVNVSDFDLQATLADVRDLFTETAKEKDIQLTFDLSPEVPPLLHGDPGSLRQILNNLVGNACKFTGQGEVAVRVGVESETATQATLRFTIRDTGIGVSADRLDRLFQAFSQVDGSSTRSYGGVGLGLAMSKKLVELLGGQIGVESQPGEGSTFWFSVPFEKQAGAALRPVLLTQPPLAEIPQQTLPRILVAEDNLVNQKLIVRLLKKLGFEADAVINGQKAVAAVKNSTYVAVLMDCEMPELNGFEATALIRQRNNETGTYTPIIALTGLDTPGDRERCLAAGMDDYLSKPLNPAALKAGLTRLLQSAKSAPDAGKGVSEAVNVQPGVPVVVASAQTADSGPARLLVAEDNLVNQKLIVRLVKNLGYQADVAGNGLEALDALARASYAAVLMDCQMPKMDGFEATALIRQRDQQAGTHIPIIAVTAHAVTGDRERCLAAGMDDYISKPVNPDLLKASLERWIPAQGTPAERPAVEDKPAQARLSLVASESGSDLLPFDLIEALNRVDGDKAFLSELAELFLTESPRALLQLQTAIQNGECDTVAQAAHSLKGSVGNFVAADAVEAAGALEALGRQGDLLQAPAALAQLEFALNCLTPALANLKLEEVA